MSNEKEPSKKPLGVMSNGISIRVGVVDDEFSHRRIVTQTLKSAGFDVIFEGINGEDAIAFVAKFKPRFLFMDLHMPRLDGLQALRSIHASNPEIRVVMVTTDSDKDHVLELINAGAAEYIVKPIDRKVLLQKVEKIVSAE